MRPMHGDDRCIEVENDTSLQGQREREKGEHVKIKRRIHIRQEIKQAIERERERLRKRERDSEKKR